VINGALPRTWKNAFRSVAAKDSDVSGIDDAGLSDFARIMGARIRKGNAFFEDPKAVMTTVIVGVVSEPLDDFVRASLDVDMQGLGCQSDLACQPVDCFSVQALL
jgi:hypothetical protein